MFTYVGETLRRLRKERGKTLDELGQEAGLGRGQLSRIENGRQEATLTTLSKVLVSQGMSRREFFRRYELVEAEAEAVDRSGALPAEGADEWPAEVGEALKKVEAFVNAAFLQPRPVAQGSIELGDLVILFRVVSKNPPQEAEPGKAPTPPPPPSKRPSRRRTGR